MIEHYLNELLRELRLNPKQFAESIGLPRTDKIYHILKGRNGVSSDLAGLIVCKYPNVDYRWLIKGEGEMLRPGAVMQSGGHNTHVSGGVSGSRNQIGVHGVPDCSEALRELRDENRRLSELNHKLVDENAKLTERISSLVDKLINK